MEKLTNKDYIAEIIRNVNTVQIKISNAQVRNYEFDNIESAIKFSVAITEAPNFVDLDKLSDSIKDELKFREEPVNRLKIDSTPTVKPKRKYTKKSKK